MNSKCMFCNTDVVEGIQEGHVDMANILLVVTMQGQAAVFCDAACLNASLITSGPNDGPYKRIYREMINEWAE